MTLHLVLGGARSGKSAYAQRAAEACAAQQRRPLVFVATAQALDEEMQARITRHQADRSGAWRTVEAPLDLAGALDGLGEAVALVDCLTLWLSNSMLAGDGDAAHGRRLDVLTTALAQRAHPTWAVSNEVGGGIVPDNALARRFRDEAGRLNQGVAAAADTVTLVVAGLPLALKGR